MIFYLFGRDRFSVDDCFDMVDFIFDTHDTCTRGQTSDMASQEDAQKISITHRQTHTYTQHTLTTNTTHTHTHTHTQSQTGPHTDTVNHIS